MPKLSQLPNDITPAVTDFLAGYQGSNTTTSRFSIANLLSIFSKPTNFTYPYKFSVYRNAAWSVGNGAGLLVTFDSKEYDTGNNYSTSTGKFTAPVSGWYRFTTSIQYGSVVDGAICLTSLCINSTTVETKRLAESLAGTAGNVTQNGSCDIFMNSGDYACITARAQGGSGGVGSIITFFSGYLFSAN